MTDQTETGQPRISVITVNYNYGSTLEDTIRSVVKQTYPHVQYIVIDGGSTDESPAIIKRYQEQIDYIVSEPDHGITDAMNKGIKAANGDYVLFLNADDYLHAPDSLAHAARHLHGGEAIYGFDTLFKSNATFTRRHVQAFCFRTNFKPNICHQGVLCQRQLLERLDCFDASLPQHVMDFDFFIRAYRQGYYIKPVKQILSVMRDTGLTSRRDTNSVKERIAAERVVHEKSCSSIPLRWLYFLYWCLYPPFKLISNRLLNRKASKLSDKVEVEK